MGAGLGDPPRLKVRGQKADHLQASPDCLETAMANRPALNSHFASALVLLAACSGSTSDNAAPNFGSIPQQRIAGGLEFTIDLESYVQDREDADTALTYSVVSGGGAVTFGTPSGDVTPILYTNRFDTIGSYPVIVRATDVGGKSTDANFDVEVTSGRLAAVQQGNTGLVLLDVDTDAMVQIVSGGNQPTYVGGTPAGCAIYQVGSGATRQLWLYDLVTRSSRRLGADKTWVNYAGQTSTGRIVYTTGPGTDSDLWIYNPTTTFTTEISAQEGEIDGSPMVTANDLIFYQRGTNGQSDVYYFDPSLGTSTAIASSASNEVLRAELVNGAVTFSRIGSSGETDLYYVSLATGVLEVGGDLGATEQAQSKTYVGATSDDKIVFELAAVSGVDLYVWNPSTGTTRTIATNAENDRFEGITSADGIVYRHELTDPNHDLYLYTWASNVSVTVSATAENENYLASLSNGDIVFELTFSADSSLDLHVYSVVGQISAALVDAGSDNYTFLAVLSDDTIVYRHDAATPVLYAHASSSATGVVVATGNDPQLRQETSGGDFVFETTSGSQSDVFLWDASAASVVTIANAAGDESFMAFTAASTVLFTRVTTGNTNADLFVWNGTSATQLTTADNAGLRYDHVVVGAFAASF